MRSLLKSSREQAVAAWVNLLNQQRIDTLLGSLTQQDTNLQNALLHIGDAMSRISNEIIERNRGGLKGMHGFIAEVAEVGISNAREAIHGNEALSTWVNDNGPADILRAGIEVQQKFVAAGGTFSLGAVLDHLEKYPGFLKDKGKYQIPADHFARLKQLQAMSQDEAGRLLTNAGDGPSYSQWQRVQRLFSDHNISIDSLEPSTLEYSQVQRGVIAKTLNDESGRIKDTDNELRQQAFVESLPTVQEALKVTAVAAAVEGVTTLVLAMIEKRREGTKFKDFSPEDWQDIVGDTAIGTAKGSVRGISIYALTNFTATSAAVASAIVTASFGIAEQAHRFRTGEITEIEFIENSEYLALEAAVSGLSSLIGQAVIPVPIIGAIIGNAVGMIMYRCAKGALSSHEEALIQKYLEEQQALDARLENEYNDLISQLDEGFSSYLSLIERAFAPEPLEALLGSIELARELGVPTEEILDTDKKIADFFLL